MREIMCPWKSGGIGQYPRAYKGPHELRFDLEEYARGVTELIDVIHAEGSTAELALEWGTGRA
jgi:hypothetical protein